MHSFVRIFESCNFTVIIPRKLYSEFQILTSYLKADENTFGVLFVPVEENENPLEQLPAGTEAVMVFPLVQHSAAETKAIFTGLNEQDIPSLSANGAAYLEHGATITFTPQFTFQQLSR